MRSVDELLQFITGPGVLKAASELLCAHDPELVQEERLCTEAVAFLKSQLPEAYSPSVEEYVSAAQRRTVAELLFAAYEGCRMNLMNFYAPYPTDFFQMDFSAYIREHLMGQSPVAIEAAQTCTQFKRMLPASCREAGEAVSGYYTLLGISGSKLAHYMGYLLSNRLLPWVIPGYREDRRQTISYSRALQGHMEHLPQ